MTLRSQITSDLSNVFFNTDEFATTATRYPAGNLSAGVSIVGVFEERDASKDTQRGIHNRRPGVFVVAATNTIQRTDRFSIEGEMWEVESIGKPDHATIHINVIRAEEYRRTEAI